MYCSCLRPFPIQNIANGEKFTVCVSSKGGCGLEIETTKDGQAIPSIIKFSDINEYERSYLCIDCEGTGVSLRDLITCNPCKGTGISR